MSVFFIGCLHFGHEGMARYRGFKDSNTHDNLIIKNWNNTVSKKDTVYILGDITMETDLFYPYLDLLNGSKKVVLGNHDLGKHVPELLKYVDTVSGMVDYKGFVLTHCPVTQYELQFYPMGNIHAHIHHENKVPSQYILLNYGKSQESFLVSNKYINVDAKLINFTPLNLDQIKNK